MKLLEQRNITKITGDVELTKFKINMNGKVARMLSDQLYQDKIKAVLRELGTNAYDSHVMAGKKNVPIEVTLPTSFNPICIIQDYGVGLSPEQVENIYTVYGVSDKDNDNSLVGALGLGSKSVFAYGGKTATIESIFNGTKYVYSALLGEDNVPVLAKLGREIPTQESNGVKITIPVNRTDISNFQSKAREVYEFFEVKPIFKGTSISFENRQVIAKGTNWVLYNTGKCSALMGGIAYNIQFSDSALKPEEVKMFNHPFYINFNIGDLDIEISREGLSYDLKTRSAITSRFKLIRTEISKSINDEIAQCKTLWDARLKAVESSGVLYEYVDRAKLEWGGTKLFNSNNNVDLPKNEKILKYNSYYRSLKYFKPKDVTQVEIIRSIKIIVNDIDKGLDSRILNYTQNGGGSADKIYVIADSQKKMLADTLGMDDQLFILASSLPKPTPKARTYTGTGVKRGHTENVMELKQGGNTLSSYYTNVQKDIDDGGKYFEFNTFKCVHNGVSIEPKMVLQISKALDKCGISQTDPIYAVKTAQIKRLAKAKKPWISYMDDALTQLDKIYANLSYINLEIAEQTINWFGGYDYTAGVNTHILSLTVLKELSKGITQSDFVKFMKDVGTLEKIREQNTVRDTIEKVYNSIGRPLPLLVGTPKDVTLICQKVKDDYYKLIKKYPLLKEVDNEDDDICAELAIYVNAK